MKESLPVSSTWFRESEIHHLEHKALPQFFLGNPGRSPEHYKYMRNAIITLCKQHPHLYISASECLNHVSGDCCDIIRVHSFLEHWGLINFTSDLMNQQTQKIFPINSTNVLRGAKELKEKELDDDWEQALESIRFRQEFREFDKFEGINWIRREISKIAGTHRPKLETKNQVIQEVIAWVKKKKGLKCDRCGKLVGECFYAIRKSAAQIVNTAISKKGPTEGLPQRDLKQRFHESLKSCDKIIRKIIKQEKESIKWCSKCHDEVVLSGAKLEDSVDKTSVEGEGPAKEAAMTARLRRTSLGELIREYSEFIHEEGDAREGQDSEQVPRRALKKKILKLINEYGGQMDRVLERVKPEERKDFLISYLEVALKDLKGLKGILRNNFDFFHRITTDLNSKKSLQDQKGFRYVQSILKQEEQLGDIDRLIKAYVDSGSEKQEQEAAKKAGAKRGSEQLEEDEEARKITEMIRDRVKRANALQKKKIKGMMKKHIYYQLAKINKKLSSVEDYEKFLMHENVILRVKENQFLTKLFIHQQSK